MNKILIFCSILLVIVIAQGTSQAKIITLAWDEVQDAEGYYIRYGYTSSSYEEIVDVGNQTTITLDALETEITYFVVTAYKHNDEGQLIESTYSNQIHFSPGGHVFYANSTNQGVIHFRDGNHTMKYYLRIAAITGYIPISCKYTTYSMFDVTYKSMDGKTLKVRRINSVNGEIIFEKDFTLGVSWTPIASAPLSGDRGSILWIKSDGNIGIWILDSSYNIQSSIKFSPLSGWIPIDISGRSDGNFNLSFKKTSTNEMAIWTVNSNGTILDTEKFSSAGTGFIPIGFSWLKAIWNSISWLKINEYNSTYIYDDTFDILSAGSWIPKYADR